MTSATSQPKAKTITFPRLIDCHVHFREPGLTHKADMATEAAAAWAGGVGTVCEMPNTVPPTVTIAALADKVRRAESREQRVEKVDIRFFFGATEMAHLQTLKELLTGSSEELQRLRARCCGLKIYFDHSTGDQKASNEVIEEAFKLCAEYHFPLVGHCEDATINGQVTRDMGQRMGIETHSMRRPPESEIKSIGHAIDLVRKTGAAFHVAHLSTAGGLKLVREAKKEGLPVTCEVAPHHLFLTTDDYDSLGTLAKMNPPLRSHEDQAALWAGIADGTVDCISTDHAPHTLDEKNADNPLDAPSGVPGVETMLPLLLTVAQGEWPNPNKKFAIRNSQFAISDITRLCFTNPNRIFKLGKKEEMMEIDLSKEWTIHAKDLHSKCGWTPYEGWNVCGRIL